MFLKQLRSQFQLIQLAQTLAAQLFKRRKQLKQRLTFRLPTNLRAVAPEFLNEKGFVK